MSLDLSSPNHIPLNVRIAEFCEDPQNMDEMSAFVDDILKKAQIEADTRLAERNRVRFYGIFFFRILMNTNAVIQFPFLQADLKKTGKGIYFFLFDCQFARV